MMFFAWLSRRRMPSPNILERFPTEIGEHIIILSPKDYANVLCYSRTIRKVLTISPEQTSFAREHLMRHCDWLGGLGTADFRGETKSRFIKHMQGVPIMRLPMAYSNYLISALPRLGCFFEVIIPQTNPDWLQYYCDLPRSHRDRPPLVVIEWLMNTVRQALELDVIVEDKACHVYFFSIWAGSLPLLRFAVSRYLRVDTVSPSPLDVPGAFPQHEKKLQDIVHEALIDAVVFDQFPLFEVLVLHPLVKKDHWRKSGSNI
ncbi:hypothetical protein HDU96_007653 [Phlyctochytrium bullatum]|nr:hypothetical protein HDU96_007653 [Phlyctochytrium bullatum]